MDMVLSCHIHIVVVRRSGLTLAYFSFVPKHFRFSPLSWSQTLGPEEPQRLKVNGVDAALEEEEVNPGKGGLWHCPINELWIYRETSMQSGLRHWWETSRPLPEGRALSNLSPGRLPAQETRKSRCPLNLFILRVQSNEPHYQRKQHRGECQGLQSARVQYARRGKVDPA